MNEHYFPTKKETYKTSQVKKVNNNKQIQSKVEINSKWDEKQTSGISQ